MTAILLAIGRPLELMSGNNLERVKPVPDPDPIATILPPNATSLEKALEQRSAGMEALLPEIRIDDLWNPATCPEDFLPWLAFAFSVDVWDPAWPVDVKRKVIGGSFKVHQHKGTPGAVRRALEAMDIGEVSISEWFQQAPEGERYTFDIEMAVTREGPDPDVVDLIIAAINTAKNRRSHLGDLRIYMQQSGASPLYAAALMTGEDITIQPWSVTDLDQPGALFFAAAMQSAETATIYPEGFQP